jgi:hypothetical protein
MYPQPPPISLRFRDSSFVPGKVLRCVRRLSCECSCMISDEHHETWEVWKEDMKVAIPRRTDVRVEGVSSGRFIDFYQTSVFVPECRFGGAVSDSCQVVPKFLIGVRFGQRIPICQNSATECESVHVVSIEAEVLGIRRATPKVRVQRAPKAIRCNARLCQAATPKAPRIAGGRAGLTESLPAGSEGGHAGGRVLRPAQAQKTAWLSRTVLLLPRQGCQSATPCPTKCCMPPRARRHLEPNTHHARAREPSPRCRHSNHLHRPRRQKHQGHNV